MSFLKLPLAEKLIDTFKLWAKEIRQTDFVTDDTISARMEFYGSVLCPIGAPLPWLVSTLPSGRFLILDGSSRPRSDFPDLFNVYKYTFGGSGDNFTLPDLRGRYLFGLATSGTGSTLGGTFGTKDHTHSIPAHYHGMGAGADLNVSSSGAHSHGITRDANSATNSGAGALWGLTPGGTAYSQTESASHTHASGSFAGRIGLVTGGVDGNAAMTSGTNNPPSIVCNWITRY